MASMNEHSQPVAASTGQKRTYKPIFWSLFAAGGMIAALVIPVLVVIFSIWLPLHPEKAMGFYQSFGWVAQNKFFLLLTAGVLFLMLWHCAHRFYYCLHDIKVSLGFRGKCVLYGVPVLAFLLTMILGW